LYTPDCVGTIRTALGLLDAQARRGWAALVLLSVGAAAAEALGTAALYAYIGIVATPAAASTWPVVGVLLAPFDGAGDRTTVVAATIALIVFQLAKTGLLLAMAWRQQGWAATARAALARRVHAAHLGAPWALRLRRSAAEDIHNVTTAVDVVFRHVLGPAMMLATEVLVVTAIVAVLFAAAPGLTLAATIAVGGFAAVLLTVTRSRAVRFGAERRHLEREVLRGVQQTFAAAKDVRVLGREAWFHDQFVQRLAALVAVQRRSEMLATMPRLLVEAVFVLAALGLVLLATLWGRTGPELVPLLGLYAYAGFRVIPSANRAMVCVNDVRFGSTTVRALADDLKRFEAAGEPADRAVAPLVWERSIELDHVSFAYEGSDREALHDLCLTIGRGESIGVVGTTGAGKSTLVDVLTGLLTPTAGRVLIDGLALPAAPRAWQRAIGYVPQAVVLVDDSLRRNVALGVPGEHIDDARMTAAVEMAQLADFVAGLPGGLDARVGENGAFLSGGERQRVGIARALYHAPSVLVLDEATAALDHPTEAALLDAIEALRGRLTLIVVAHRLSSVRPCDRIVVLDGGRVVAVGGYDELLRDSVEFQRMATVV
jgi:ATP-binding cassette, subfamily B, bacterial PglK